MADRFEESIERLLGGLGRDNLGVAVEIARVVQDVRGYGPVREAAMQRVAAHEAVLWEQFELPSVVRLVNPRVAA